MEGLACGLVPDNGGLALVGDTDALDLGFGVALVLKGLDSLVDARLDGADELLGVMLVPPGSWYVSQCFSGKGKPHAACLRQLVNTNLPWLGVDLFKLNLVNGDNLAITVEDDEAGAGCALVNGTDKSGRNHLCYFLFFSQLGSRYNGA